MTGTLTPLERELVDSLKRTAKNLCALSPAAQETMRPLVDALELATHTARAGKQLADSTVSVRLGDVLKKILELG